MCISLSVLNRAQSFLSLTKSLHLSSLRLCLFLFGHLFRLNQSKVADRGQTQNHAGSLHSPQVRQVRFGESRFSDEKTNEWNWFVNTLAVVQDAEFSFVLKAEIRPRILLFAPLCFLTILVILSYFFFFFFLLLFVVVTKCGAGLCLLCTEVGTQPPLRPWNDVLC